MKRSLTVRVRYTMIKREFYETRNRETGPRPCRGCASRHPRNVDPGQGHFYLSFEYEHGTSLENQAIPYVLRSFRSNFEFQLVPFDRVFFLFRFFFFFHCNDCSFFLVYLPHSITECYFFVQRKRIVIGDFL